jgi:mitochondrial fission protein ELM1
MENQCRGLAEALGVEPAVRRIAPRRPWVLLPPGLWPYPLHPAVCGARLEPPWPDLLISCGRRSVATALAIRRASAGRTFAVHIQAPHVPVGRFDLVVVPRHDRLSGENVVVTRGALHRITGGVLGRAAATLAPVYAALPRPLIAVLVGGSNRRQTISAPVIEDFAAKLRILADSHRAGLAITPSRRTGEENVALLRERLEGVPMVFWDGTGENPYFALLALADTVVVTGDSVSMVSEACSTGKPVYVYDLEGGSTRLQAFHAALRREGITRPLDDSLERWSYDPLDETTRVAEIVRERLAARTSDAREQALGRAAAALATGDAQDGRR